MKLNLKPVFMGAALLKSGLFSSSSLLSKTGGHFVFATHRTCADIRWVTQPIKLQDSSYTGSSYTIMLIAPHKFDVTLHRL